MDYTELVGVTSCALTSPSFVDCWVLSVYYCKPAVFALSAYLSSSCTRRAAPGGSTTKYTGSRPLGMLIVSSFPVSLMISALALLVTLALTSISSYPTS